MTITTLWSWRNMCLVFQNSILIYSVGGREIHFWQDTMRSSSYLFPSEIIKVTTTTMTKTTTQPSKPLEMVLKARSKWKKKYLLRKIYENSVRKVWVCGFLTKTAPSMCSVISPAEGCGNSTLETVAAKKHRRPFCPSAQPGCFLPEKSRTSTFLILSPGAWCWG